MQRILQNLMALNNTITVDGVKYSAAVDMIFDREVPRMNGSLISADNVTACMSAFLLMATQSYNWIRIDPHMTLCCLLGNL